MNKHVVFTNGRSGSNYLVTLLNSHPQITNYGEVLGDWTLPYKVNQRLKLGARLFDNYGDYLDYIYSSKVFFYSSQLYSIYARLKKRQPTNFKPYSQIKSIGIKDFAINFEKRNIADYLQNREDILIIHLYRENSLKRLISLQAMTDTGVVKSVGQDKTEKPKLYLSPNNIIDRLVTFEREKQEQFEMLESITESRVINISYEYYFSNSEQQQKINRKILDFLKIDRIELEGRHQKILDSSLANTLKNYEEIYEQLIDTEYARYLNP